MEVKTGFKQTEVGVIPEGWQVKRLRERLVQPPTYGVVKAGAFGRSGVPMVRGGDLKGGRLAEDQPLISEEKSREYSRTVLRAGDVVIALVGYPGETAVVPPRLAGANISRAVGLIRPDKGLLPEFLKGYLNSPSGRKEFLRPGAGSAQMVVNLRDLSALRLPVPPVLEQRSIAEALSDADALIEALEQLIAKKRLVKQGAMQELLTGKRRLSGFSGSWDVKQLGQLLRFQVGFPFSSVHFNQKAQGMRLIKNRDLKSDDTAYFYSGRFDSAYVVRDGDVLVGMDGDFMPCRWRNGSALLNQRVGRLHTSPDLDKNYAYYALIKPLKAIEAITSSTTVKHLSHGDLAAIEQPVPPIREQRAIGTTLSDMDEEIAALEAKLEKARLIKQGMMQNLLTGSIRLS